MPRHLAALFCLAALLGACRAPGLSAGREGPLPVAADTLAEEAAREGWQDFRVLQREHTVDRSFALGTYRDRMEFETGQMALAECYAFQHWEDDPADGGGGGGGGGCEMAGAEPTLQDFAWGSDDPLRIIGTAPADLAQVEIVFRDGTAQVIDTLATQGFGRVVYSAVLVQPVADVVEVRVPEA